jgi:hypothetical protein
MFHFTEFFQLLTAIAAAAAAVQSFLNGRRSAKIEKNVAVIEKATNSMKDALVASTAKASYSAGVRHGENNPREPPNATPG